jgi:hypothetical protein
MSHSLSIDWSVWDRNPVVSWVWNGLAARVVFQKPPIAVCPLIRLGKMAIAGNFEEFGPENLLIYSSTDLLLRKYCAPAFGSNPQFGWIDAAGGALEVAVGYKDERGLWMDMIGQLNPDDGSISKLRRGY